MAENEELRPAPNGEPLFRLDLGPNGGQLAPSSIQDLLRWIQQEVDPWQWAVRRTFGGHQQGFQQAWGHLSNALGHAQRAEQSATGNPGQSQNEIEACRRNLEQCFVGRQLPHTSTPTAKRVLAFRSSAGEEAASYMLTAYVPPDPGQQILPRELSSWRGLVEALLDRFNMLSAVPKAKKAAAEQSFEQLRTSAQHLIDEKKAAYDALHRDYERLAASIEAARTKHNEEFVEAQTSRAQTFDTLVDEHKAAMEGLRKTFREEIALRAPAAYWRTKQVGHRWMAGATGAFAFGGIAAAMVVISQGVQNLLGATAPGQFPEIWRLSLVVLIGVFAVWAVRLVVRMFLSHLHLAGDAAERVVMVQTYLSLLEGDRLTTKEDRQLILQALFRPASDGIVKDDGVPASFVELLTRSPRS